MKLPLPTLAFATLAYAFLAPGTALAVDENGVSITPRATISSQTLYTRAQDAEVGAGLDLIVHRGHLSLGLNFDVNTDLTEVDTYVGALAGVEAKLFEHLRFSLLGEVGGHHLADSGISLGGGARSSLDSATLPYAGARGVLDLLLGGSVDFVLGIDGIARADLGRSDVVLHVSSGGLRTYQFGGGMLAVGLHLGLRF
jgi:hypothetical protein